MESKVNLTAVNKFFENGAHHKAGYRPSGVPIPPVSPSTPGKNRRERLVDIFLTVPNVPVSRPQSQDISPPESPKFNPNAPTFVPSHRRNGSGPYPPAIVANGQHQCASSGVPPAAWNPFVAGIATASANEQAMYAGMLVAHLPHTSSEPRGELPGQVFEQLADAFCLQARSPELNGSTVADFVKAVHTELKANPAHGQWAADSFAWHIKEFLFPVFTRSWNLAISAPCAPLSLCPFVGHLYKEQFIPAITVQQCLNFLLSQIQMTPFIYHLQAIHTLLQHSSERLWRGHEAGNTLRDVVATLGQRVSAVGRWSQFGAGGAVCKARKQEADKLHKDIANMLNRWQPERHIHPRR